MHTHNIIETTISGSRSSWFGTGDFYGVVRTTHGKIKNELVSVEDDLSATVTATATAKRQLEGGRERERGTDEGGERIGLECLSAVSGG